MACLLVRRWWWWSSWAAKTNENLVARTLTGGLLFLVLQLLFKVRVWCSSSASATAERRRAAVEQRTVLLWMVVADCCPCGCGGLGCAQLAGALLTIFISAAGYVVFAVILARVVRLCS